MEVTLFYQAWLVMLMLFRFATMLISRRNEKKLKSVGAVEYGKSNTTLLILAHFAYYFFCILEGYGNGISSNPLTLAGLVLLTASIGVLYYVIYQLRNLWTVRLIIAPAAYHQINNSFLFRHFRHPNYYLNILPELVAVALIFQAWVSLAVGFPLYLILFID